VKAAHPLPIIYEAPDFGKDDGNRDADLADEGGIFVDEYELDDTYASFLGSYGAEGSNEMEILDGSEGMGLFSDGCIIG
jgi:hypothetical protein